MQQSLTRWERLALIAVLAVGAWLRFQHLGAIEYNVDQVYPIWQALTTLDDGSLPLAGQGTSVLFANPSLTGYFFLPVIALTRQPVAAYMLTLTLNTLAVWLAYRGLRWLVGTRPALVGAALFAVNPWIIEDSRRTWVQSLSPFFACLIFWALIPVLTGQTRHPARRTLIALVGLALFAHTYLLAYALVVPVGLLIVVFWRRVPKRALVAGGMVFAVLMSLYAVGLAREWESTRQRAEAFSSGQARLSEEALKHGIRLVTGWEYAIARGNDAPADDADLRRDLSDVADWTWTAILALGIGLAVGALVRRPAPDSHARDAALILLAWCALPVLMMSYVSRDVHPFYLLLSVPAGHGLAGWGAGSLLRRRGLAPLIVAALVFVGAVNGLNAVRFAQESAATPGEHLPYTMNLAEITRLGRQIRAERAPDMAIFSGMDAWTPVTMAGEMIRSAHAEHLDRAALIPAGGALYLLSERDPQAAIQPPPYADPVGEPLVLRDGARIGLWRALPQDVTIPYPADIPSDVDVSFAGWALEGDLAPGQTVTLTTFWRIEALHPDRGVWALAPYAHLYDAGGVRVAIADGTVIPPLTWAAGDLMVQRIALAVPGDSAGPYMLYTGLYDSVRGLNAIFRVPSGGETAYTADIPIGPPPAVN